MTDEVTLPYVATDLVVGSAALRRVGLWRFPVWKLVRMTRTGSHEVLAQLGRDGWFRVFFGRGRKVEVPNGTRWRIVSAGAGGYLVPMVVSPTGKMAVGAPHGRRSYGINTRDHGYTLYPAGSGSDGSTWRLREHDTDVATFGPRALWADQPVPLGAVLLCFTLIKYGVPGHANLWIPEFRW